MTFSSGIFLYRFLPAFLLVYLVVPRSWKAYIITVASYVFCAWWRPDGVVPMLAITLLGFVAGALIGRSRARGRKGRVWLLASVTGIIGALACFKYADSAVDLLNVLVRGVGLRQLASPDTLLPLGVSFYTFKAVSYVIDVYRGISAPARGFHEFMCYIALFPQLASGPIARFKTSVEQLQAPCTSIGSFYQGVLFFQVGLASKVLVADTVGYVADQSFGTTSLTLASAWIGALAYALQLLFDFAGYSDMAIGLGLMMGLRIPVNFNRPYLAVSISDFWQRWHITLSTWLRDYLFLPLAYAGSRRVRDFRVLGFSQDYYLYSAAALITMTLAGLWHGAGWTFIVWGFYQGMWLTIDRFLGRKRICRRAPPRLRIGITFLITLVGWVFFRSPSLAQAADHLSAMIALCPHPFAPLSLEIRPFHVLMGMVGAVWVCRGPATHELVPGLRPAAVFVMQLVFLVTILHLHFQDHVPFLYYQF